MYYNISRIVRNLNSYPKFFFRGGKWEKEDSSQEWRFQNEYADGCAFPFPEYSNAQAIYELIIMDEDLPTGKGGYLKAWLKTDLPTKGKPSYKGSVERPLTRPT